MHIPVLQKEVIEYLDPKPNENFIDCTLGFAGHTLAILEKNGPKGKVLGIDADAEVIKNTKYYIQNTKYKDRVVFACDNFVNLKEIIKREKFKNISGILFDLGMSSWHLEESGRGFSFLRNEPLDMRYNLENPLTPLEVNRTRQRHKENKPLTGLTAEKIVNYWSKSEIEKILREYGEERFAKKIAERIIESRAKPIETTFQLIEIIKSVIPRKYQVGRLHPATRTFQALRIAVNDELNNLEKTLPQAINVLNRGGRLVVISFHSLEDRIVKNFLKKCGGDAYVKLITKKPIGPSKDYYPPSALPPSRAPEIIKNPRSRSAKLRSAIKI